LISNSSARSKRAAESADAAPVPRRKSTPPFTPEQNKEPDEGRRALWEAFEEDAHPPLSGVQTGQFIRFSKRRCQAYARRIARARRAVLKAEGGDGQTYSDDEKHAFIWYSYLFLGRGKPSTHLLALNQLEDDELVEDAPEVLTRLIERIEHTLNPPPAEQ
jgi:hypothetical protein